MEPELDKCGFCGEEWNKHECVPTNEWGLRLLFAGQDSRADPFV